jgi:hypothetical protein
MYKGNNSNACKTDGKRIHVFVSIMIKARNWLCRMKRERERKRGQILCCSLFFVSCCGVQKGSEKNNSIIVGGGTIVRTYHRKIQGSSKTSNTTQQVGGSVHTFCTTKCERGQNMM